MCSQRWTRSLMMPLGLGFFKLQQSCVVGQTAEQRWGRRRERSGRAAPHGQMGLLLGPLTGSEPLLSRHHPNTLLWDSWGPPSTWTAGSSGLLSHWAGGRDHHSPEVGLRGVPAMRTTFCSNFCSGILPQEHVGPPAPGSPVQPRQEGASSGPGVTLSVASLL